MVVKFTKMQGCGNDYVYINCLSETVTDAAELAIKVSDRHYGIGSDGLILIKKSEIADFTMDMYNADGSQGKMCGNAIRCVGKYVYDHGMTDKKELLIETLSGIKKLFLNITDGRVTSVKVDMGIPVMEPAKVPVIYNGEKAVDIPVNVLGKDYLITGISMGNPHGVVFMDEVDTLELESIGPMLEGNEIFHERANIEFVKIVDRANIDMRVWERGSAETWACGTGACASAYNSIIHGLCDDSVQVKMRGGSLIIDYCREDGHIYMTGPAVEVFNGFYNI